MVFPLLSFGITALSILHAIMLFRPGAVRRSPKLFGLVSSGEKP
jgi:hypothetical protein